MRKIIPYQPWLKKLARELRNNSTKSEIILWGHLKGKKMLGYDFHRQKPIDSYIVDFYCCELFLAIELDGITHHHEDTVKADNYRENRLNQLGIIVLRFDDKDVFKNIGWVLEEIEIKINEIRIYL